MRPGALYSPFHEIAKDPSPGLALRLARYARVRTLTFEKARLSKGRGALALLIFSNAGLDENVVTRTGPVYRLEKI